MRKFNKPRAIANETYRHYAKKYGISLGKSYRKLAQQIYDHDGVRRGLYFRP